MAHRSKICSAVVGGMLVALLVVFSVGPAKAQQGGDAYFEQNCSSCHSIGAGYLVGPDLKDVTQRAERKWLLEFMRNPDRKVAAKDAYALKLREQSQGAAMPAFPELNNQLGEEVLRYIESRSAGVHPQPTLSQTQGDSGVGRALFIGTRQLTRGGAACMACHQAAGLPAAGGKLGPDLTLALRRLGGERGLSAWIQRPPTPVMAAVYRDKQLNDQEVAALVAFFGTTAEHSEQARETPRRAVQLTGVGMSLLAFVVAGLVWRKRSRGIRETVVGKREVE